MTDNTEASAFWVDARRPAGNNWMDRGARNADAWYAARQPAPEPEPITPEPDAVAALSLAEYAQHRDLAGIRNASEFVGLDKHAHGSGFPDAGATLTAEQRTQLGLATTHDWAVQPGAPRGIPADCLPESFAGIKGRGTIRTTNQNT